MNGDSFHPDTPGLRPSQPSLCSSRRSRSTETLHKALSRLIKVVNMHSIGACIRDRSRYRLSAPGADILSWGGGCSEMQAVACRSASACMPAS
jgi:hypothetical protein